MNYPRHKRTEYQNKNKKNPLQGARGIHPIVIKNNEDMKIKNVLFFALMMSLFMSIDAKAQIKVGLDNWFNNETNAKTGQPFHYLWNDSAFSGYSRLGKIFEKDGAVLSTLKKPTKTALSKINNIYSGRS